MEEKKGFSVKDVVLGLESRLTSWLLRRARRDKYIPPRVFDELLGTIPGGALEVVPLFVDKGGNINVFLTKRDEKDPYWPGLWHSPGTIVLNKDEYEKKDFGKAWERLKKNELLKESLAGPVPVSVKLVKSRRGKEIALIHYVLVPDNLEGGQYFPVNELPGNLVDHHLEIIKEASYDLYASYLSGRLELDKALKQPVIGQNAS